MCLFLVRFAIFDVSDTTQQIIVGSSGSGKTRFPAKPNLMLANAEKFLRLVRKYTEPKELTTVMVHELIDKIIVHAPDKSSGRRIQQIDIRYNFIGEMEFSAEYATRTTA